MSDALYIRQTDKKAHCEEKETDSKGIYFGKFIIVIGRKY